MCKFLIQGNLTQEPIIDSLISDNLKMEHIKDINLPKSHPTVSTTDILQKIRKLDEIANYFQEKSKSYLRIIKTQKKQIDELSAENKNLKEKNEQLEEILKKNEGLSKKYNECQVEIESLKTNIENLESEILNSKLKSTRLFHRDSVESEDKTWTQSPRKSFNFEDDPNFPTTRDLFNSSFEKSERNSISRMSILSTKEDVPLSQQITELKTKRFFGGKKINYLYQCHVLKTLQSFGLNSQIIEEGHQEMKQ